ncbi:UNVERIFIED_CONTAM: Jerky-like protein [Trichonephila clavipes]
MREANSVLLDRALYLWFSQRSKGDPISGPLLYEKALELNEKLGGSADFKGSTECGRRRLLQGRCLQRRRDWSKLEGSAKEVIGFKMGVHSSSKEGVTSMVCANASGTHSLPLLVIGKSKKPCCFKNVSCLPTLYKMQKSG